jgi:3-mercaptopyruvate sulfurtransferase SseA
MLDSRRSSTLIALAVAGALLTACSGLTGQAPASPPPAPTSTIPPWHYPDVPRVTVADAKAALDLGSATFLDVRPAEDYKDQHIPGAVHIFYEDIEEHAGELDKAEWIITYCN